jgi:hypothetical protein
MVRASVLTVTRSPARSSRSTGWAVRSLTARVSTLHRTGLQGDAVGTQLRHQGGVGDAAYAVADPAGAEHAGAGGEAQITVELPAALVPTSSNPRGAGLPTMLVGPDDGFDPDPVDGAHELRPVRARRRPGRGRPAGRTPRPGPGRRVRHRRHRADRPRRRILLRPRTRPSQRYTDVYQWADRHGLLADPAAAKA